MKLIQLDISALKTSDSQNNAYVLLLNEIEGKRQLPIVIGWCEARSIALALEDSDPPERPLTHDLFLSIGNIFGITISKVVIHTLSEGIFHASFFCKSARKKEVEIDARTSDAVARRRSPAGGDTSRSLGRGASRSRSDSPPRRISCQSSPQTRPPATPPCPGPPATLGESSHPAHGQAGRLHF